MNIYDDYDDYEYKEDESKNFQAEVDAYDRVGPSGRLAELLSTTVTDMNRLGQENIPPEDRFLIMVDAVSRRLNTDGIANISQNDIDTMLEKTQIIPEIKYKNVFAYILGFLASNGGSKMDQTNVMYVLNTVLPKLDGEGGVEKPDVIRYARYWMKFL